MMTATVTLTLTTEQAEAMARQLDLASRIHMCQFREIEMMARMGRIKHRNGRELTIDECAALDDLLTTASGLFGFASNASFGIGSPHVSDDAHRGWEIQKVVQHALAMHRDPNPSLRGCDYDGLIVRYTNDPAPVAKIVET